MERWLFVCLVSLGTLAMSLSVILAGVVVMSCGLNGSCYGAILEWSLILFVTATIGWIGVFFAGLVAIHNELDWNDR